MILDPSCTTTDTITDENGAVVERQSFSPFGARRNVTDWSDPISQIFPQETHHGFTGHEHLDGVGLIHMNGRVYDPVLGRFLSADPNVQSTKSTQALNRYTYLNNNPLNATDPSGFFLKKLFKGIKKLFKNKFFRLALAFVVGPWAGLFIGTTLGLPTLAGYAIAGFTTGFIASDKGVKYHIDAFN